MTTLKLINARRWAALHANERKAPTYIYQTPNSEIVISLVERTATIDGTPLELLEEVQP